MPSQKWYLDNSKVAAEMGDAAATQAAKGTVEGMNQRDAAKQEQSRMKLADLLKGNQLEKEHALNAKSAQDAISRYMTTFQAMKDKGMIPKGASLKMGPDGSINIGSDVLQAAEIKGGATGGGRQTIQDQKQAIDLSKRYEKTSGFISALKDMEDITNRDGKGGVITNTGAKMLSTGKLLSAVPDAGIGLAGLVSKDAAGMSEERKTLARLKLEYQKSMAGAKQSDSLRAAENAALGNIASGDPDLTAKSIRSLARNVDTHLGAIQAGYRPDVLESVHNSPYGIGNPRDAFAGMAKDTPMGTRTAAAPPPPAQPPAPNSVLNTAGGALSPKAQAGGGGLSAAEQQEYQQLLKQSGQ